MSSFTKVVGAIIVSVWAACMVAQIATRSTAEPFVTPLEVHGLVGVVVGALYTKNQIDKRGNGDS
jgi:hypothetical protein